MDAQDLFPDPPYRGSERSDIDPAIQRLLGSPRLSPDEGFESAWSASSSSPLAYTESPTGNGNPSPGSSSAPGTCLRSDVPGTQMIIPKEWRCPLHEGILNHMAMEEFIGFCADFRATTSAHRIPSNCARGFDQVGYFISTFLVERRNWEPEAAASAVRKAREPGICPQRCVDTLYARHGSFERAAVISLTQVRPALDGIRCKAASLISQMPGVRTIENSHEVKWLQGIAAQLGGFEGQGFCGNMAAVLSESSFKKLAEAPYRVSYKSDGMRLLMLLTNPGETYLLGEQDLAFQVSGLSFPYGDGFEARLFTTLLDGEMVFDPKEGRIIPRFIIRDIIHFRLAKTRLYDFHQRTSIVQKGILEARFEAAKAGVISMRGEPFEIGQKEYFPIDMTPKILAPKFRSKVPHRVEGLIFQSVHKPYTAGTDDAAFEWEMPPYVDGRVADSQEALLDFISVCAARESKQS